MVGANRDFPQEWPPHLGPEAPVDAVRATSPLGAVPLDFPRMPSATFEQFCWWLIQKDHALCGCQRLGRSGAFQGGIDLFAYDALRPGELKVFECKSGREFNPTALTDAVNAFFDGPWHHQATTFTIILACELGGSLADRWHKERARLRQAGIEGDLWDIHKLTLKTQPHPDILSKFFSGENVEFYANRWMRRVAFHELVTKAFSDPREHVVNRARELVSEGEEAGAGEAQAPVVGNFRSVNRFGSNWSFKGPWFSLNAIIPGESFARASAAISFNRADLNGVTIVVEHEWLMTQFLFAAGAPLQGAYRGFLVGELPGSQGRYVVDFPHCRLTLDEHGVREIAYAADLLTGVMRDELRALETAWSAVDFPFVAWAGRKVALAAVDAEVWRWIGLFVEAFDFSRGSTPLHMFDGNRNVLKPYNPAPTGRFDAGYHGIFYAAEIEGLAYSREVVLLWQPRELQEDSGFSSRGWWSCEEAWRWLTEDFLPQVKRWAYERTAGSCWRRIVHSRRLEEYSAHLDELFVARDLRTPPLVRDGSWSCGILESVRELQSFFALQRTPEPYVTQQQVEALYAGVARLARSGRGYDGYIASKLGLDSTRASADRHGLVEAILAHVREGRVVPSRGTVDYVFRAMLEVLNESDDWLSTPDMTSIRDCLAPFARIRDDAILVDRHAKWA